MTDQVIPEEVREALWQQVYADWGAVQQFSTSRDAARMAVDTLLSYVEHVGVQIGEGELHPLPGAFRFDLDRLRREAQ